MYSESELYHHGIKGQRWGVRRFQNEDGTLTSEGKKHVAQRSRSTFKAAKGLDLSKLGTSGGGGSGGSPLDEEDQKKLEEDLERMRQLVLERIENGEFDRTPLVTDDDDVSVILYEDGIDPTKLTKEQFDWARKTLQDFDKEIQEMVDSAKKDSTSKAEPKNSSLEGEPKKDSSLKGEQKTTTNSYGSAHTISSNPDNDDYDHKKKEQMINDAENRKRTSGGRPTSRKKYVTEATGTVKRRSKAGTGKVGHSYQAPSESELYHCFGFFYGEQK